RLAVAQADRTLAALDDPDLVESRRLRGVQARDAPDVPVLEAVGVDLRAPARRRARPAVAGRDELDEPARPVRVEVELGPAGEREHALEVGAPRHRRLVARVQGLGRLALERLWVVARDGVIA